jgi:hypothetical protein
MATPSQYHANVKPVSRGKGKSAVGAVAYITGENLYNEETGETCRRNHKGDVWDYGMAARAEAPEQFLDLDRLAETWNAVQTDDSRINARLAQHWNFALSGKLTPEQNFEIVKSIAHAFCDRYGYMAAYSLHEPTQHGNKDNWHGHLVNNMKEVGPDGFADKKIRYLTAFAEQASETEWMRATIAEKINEGFEKAGLPDRWSHLSYAEQGIDREPTKHLGNKQNQAELQGVPTPTGDENREIRARNEERELADKAEAEKYAVAIDKVTSQIQQLQQKKAEEMPTVQEIVDDSNHKREQNQGWRPVGEDEIRAHVPLHPEDHQNRLNEEEEKQRVQNRGKQLKEGWEEAADVHRKLEEYRQIESQRDFDRWRGKAEDAARQQQKESYAEAEEAERKKTSHQQQYDQQVQGGEIVDANLRYSLAVSSGRYDITDWMVSKGRIAEIENHMFKQDQYRLHREIQAEQDPIKREDMEFRYKIQEKDYMARTEYECSETSFCISGSRNAEETMRTRADADNYAFDAAELRKQRDNFIEQNRDQFSEQRQQQQTQQREQSQRQQETELQARHQGRETPAPSAGRGQEQEVTDAKMERVLRENAQSDREVEQYSSRDRERYGGNSL